MTDRFRLADVIIAAQKILAECPQISKHRLGGLALVGNKQGFFVAVNVSCDFIPSIFICSLVSEREG